MDQELKDMYGFHLGRIRTEDNGRQKLEDMYGFPAGQYDPRTNQTTDSQGFPAGQGNLLSAFLTPWLGIKPR